jgi:thiamine-monophosphate kinase
MSPQGEFELIDALRARFVRRGDRVVVGSGDDAAVARCDGVTVTSVDAFVEGVHFRLATTSMRDLGHKCLAGAVSDVAAMGAEPGEAYLVIGLPEHLAPEEVVELADGAEALAAETGFAICGGDLSRARELFVAVTATGYAAAESDLAGRDGAEAGDLIGVTGALGGAGAGLLLLERKLSGLDAQVGEALMARQLRPTPRLDAGRALARAGVHAMIDLSDGVASDCARIAEQSGVAIEVRLADLPLDEGVAAVAQAAQLDPAELAAAAGEDYELLFAAPERAAGEIERAAVSTGLPVTWIGRVVEGEGVRLLDEAGRARPLSGWDHFRDRGESGPPGRAAR